MTESEVETLRNMLKDAENRSAEMEERYDRLTVDYARLQAESKPKCTHCGKDADIFLCYDCDETTNA